MSTDYRRAVERLAYVRARQVQLREELAAVKLEAGGPLQEKGVPQDMVRARAAAKRHARLVKAQHHRELGLLAREEARLVSQVRGVDLEALERNEAAESVQKWFGELYRTRSGGDGKHE